MKNLIKKPKFLIAFVVIICLGVGGWKYFSSSKNPTYDFATAEKRDLVQEVSVAGRVKPAESINLAFEKSGRVSHVYADVGDKVGAGEKLVALENAELSAQLLQAEANLEAEQAKLNELKKGVRPEEIQVQETKVINAKIALEDARANLIDKIKDAYTKSEDSVRVKTVGIFSGYKSNVYQFTYTTCDAESETKAEFLRLKSETELDNWKKELDTLGEVIDSAALKTASKTANERMAIFSELLLNINATLVTGCSAADSNLDNYRSAISTARTNVNTAIANLRAAEEKFKTAESALALAEQELSLQKAGTVEEQIEAQKAKVKSAQANIQNCQAQIAKTIIRSPISGVITAQNAKVGEIVSPNAIIVSLISEAKFEIEANVPESDIAKLKIGDSAKATLDAYGSGTVFEAKVAKIDPAETIIDGVATYKTTFQFTKYDSRIKSGMTADINILTEKKEGVITVPNRTVIAKNEDKFVKILDGKEAKEIKVITGLRGSDGTVEIIEGVNEGDKIIIFSK
jgi:RND family efflux transporter MFP subunit